MLRNLYNYLALSYTPLYIICMSILASMSYFYCYHSQKCIKFSVNGSEVNAKAYINCVYDKPIVTSIQ